MTHPVHAVYKEVFTSAAVSHTSLCFFCGTGGLGMADDQWRAEWVQFLLWTRPIPTWPLAERMLLYALIEVIVGLHVFDDGVTD
ncbi:Uncharacterised protein [Mycobacteroides abscessus subsp. massiliense]|nr:Uncharacterised protein [Mycobacteroides abscessus subsp. massiliense]SKU77019.1 Uncharacterised protein [Mycobacteroides abscessus subsp. massiliense]